MKRKSIIPIVVLVAASVALLVIFLILKDKKDNPTKQPDAAKTITVMTVDADSVTRLVINNRQYSGEFVKDGEKWYNDDDIPNPVVFENLIHDFLANLKAINKIENPAADAEYGLADPSATLTAYAGDSVVVSIRLGDKIPTKDQYYCKFEGDSSVYAVTSFYANYMLRERSYYASRMTLPTISKVNYIQEVKLEGTLFTPFRAVRDKSNPYDYSGAYLLQWLFYEPYRAPSEADTINSAWTTQMEWYLSVGCDDMHPVKPEEFAKYGLTNPGAKLTVRYTNEAGTEETSYTLLIGDRTESGGYYAKLQGADVLLIMSEAQVLGMCDVDVFACTYGTLFFPSATHLSKIELDVEGQAYVIEHTKENDADVYRFNGKEISSDAMLNWSNQALALTATAYRPVETPSSAPYMTIKLEPYDKEKNKSMELRFFHSDDGYDIVERHGVCDFAIDSRSVAGFINYMKGIQSGQ